jgi:hypothetical protein
MSGSNSDRWNECKLSVQVDNIFVAWGPNSQLQLVGDHTCSGSGYFFDRSCVNYPTGYLYPSNYSTRTLVTLHPTP